MFTSHMASSNPGTDTHLYMYTPPACLLLVILTFFVPIGSLSFTGYVSRLGCVIPGPPSCAA